MNKKPNKHNRQTYQPPRQRYTNFEQGLQVLQKQLGYSFNAPGLAKLALTHRSFDGKINYERLEFLGDALLGMIIGESLYHQYPKQDEGRLTRMRATLVRQESLVLIAQKLHLSSHLILGVGELKGGGRERASILADVVEAMIGAIYLDSQNMDTVKGLVLDWYAELIDKVNDQRVLKDAKSRLQEWLQGYKFELPLYELLETKGNAPNQIFIVRCEVEVPNSTPIIESGESRRIAEQKTAEKMINQLNKLVSNRVIKV